MVRLILLLFLIFSSPVFGIEVDIDNNNAVDIGYGGTNAQTAESARTNLGLGTMAVENDAPSDGTEYLRKDGAWANSTGGGAGAVDSVNGETGTVVLDADDIDDTSTTNKWVTTALINAWNALVTFPGFGTDHSTAAYGDHNHSGVYEPAFDYGTGTGEIDAADIPINDTNGNITATDADGALTEMAGYGEIPSIHAIQYYWGTTFGSYTITITEANDNRIVGHNIYVAETSGDYTFGTVTAYVELPTKTYELSGLSVDTEYKVVAKSTDGSSESAVSPELRIKVESEIDENLLPERPASDITVIDTEEDFTGENVETVLHEIQDTIDGLGGGSAYDFATAGDYPASSDTMVAPDTLETYLETTKDYLKTSENSDSDDDVTNDNVESMQTAGAVGTVPMSDGAAGLTMTDVLTPTEGDDAYEPKGVTADEVAFTPAGNIEATDVDGAIKELDTEKQTDIDNILNYLGTGIISGFTLSVNGVDNTTVDISSGVGYIVNNSNPASPTKTKIEYAGTTGLELTYIGSSNITYLAVNSSSEVTQQTTPFTPIQRRSLLVLGAAIHSNFTIVNAVNNLPDVVLDTADQLNDFLDSLQNFNSSGNVITYNGANLSINKSAGTIFKKGSNFANSNLNPHLITTAGLTAPATLRYRLRDSTEYSETAFIDPDYYDLAGVRTAVLSNKWTIQRLTLFTSNLIRIQYGQAYYGSKAEAIQAISTEVFVTEPNILANGLLRGFLVVKAGATDLSDDTEAVFLDAGKFGDVSVLTSGAGTTTLQQAYDNGDEPEILTNSIRGAVSIQGGTGTDTDNVLEINNNAGTTTFTIDGNGLVTGLTASEIEVNEIGTSSYDDVQDWMNNTQSAGYVDGFVITDGGSGTINISAGKGYVKSGATAISPIYSFDLAGSNGVALTNNSPNYIRVNYGSGTPAFAVETSKTSNSRDSFYIGKVWRTDTALKIVNAGLNLNEQCKKIQGWKNTIFGELEHRTGMALAETGTRYLTVTAGTYYSGFTPLSTSAIDTTPVTGTDTFEIWNDAASTTADATGQTQWPNVQRWNGSALVDLSNNKFGNLYWFMDANGELAMQYGTGDYSSVADALDAERPVAPTALDDFSVYIGRLVFEKNASTASDITNANIRLESSSSVSSHANLNTLGWVESLHTGTANTIAGFGATGLAEEKSIGTTTGTIAAGDDSRFTDARTPTTHASTHATGQADAIAPGDIGAEPATSLITITESGALSAAQLTGSRITMNNAASATMTLCDSADALALSEGSCWIEAGTTNPIIFDPIATDQITFYTGTKTAMVDGYKLTNSTPAVGDCFVLTPTATGWSARIVFGTNFEDGGP